MTSLPTLSPGVDHSPEPASEPTNRETRPFPLVLQERARRAVRAHLWRGTVRHVVLVASDVIILTLVRFAVRGIGDERWLGAGTAEALRTLVPQGSFPTAALAVSVLLGLLVMGTYGAGDRRREPWRVLAGAGLGLALVSWAHLWNDFALVRAIGVVLGAMCIGTLLIISRVTIDVLLHNYRKESRHAARVLVIGPAAEARRVLAEPVFSDKSEFQVLGFIDTSPYPASDAIGAIDDIVRIIGRIRADTIVLAGYKSAQDMSTVIDIADSAGCQVCYLPPGFELPEIEPQLVWRRGAPLLQLTRPGIRGQQMAVKRAFDVVVAAIGLCVLAPLIVSIAIAIRCTSRGPVIFRQLRVGRGGRRFYIYKFRSMTADAEARRKDFAAKSVYSDGRLFKLRDDPRVTPIGTFLRRTSLDELPQLWNVLRGDMSLVGPRPPIPSEVALYHDHHYARFDVKPGITGPWQVNGRNRITDFEEVVRLELAYIRHWSIRKDFEILLKTFPVVLKMDGAH